MDRSGVGGPGHGLGGNWLSRTPLVTVSGSPVLSPLGVYIWKRAQNLFTFPQRQTIIDQARLIADMTLQLTKIVRK
jgi:hypothetical protein